MPHDDHGPTNRTADRELVPANGTLANAVDAVLAAALRGNTFNAKWMMDLAQKDVEKWFRIKREIASLPTQKKGGKGPVSGMGKVETKVGVIGGCSLDRTISSPNMIPPFRPHPPPLLPPPPPPSSRFNPHHHHITTTIQPTPFAPLVDEILRVTHATGEALLGLQCDDFAQFLKMCTTRTGSPGAIILRAEKTMASGGDGGGEDAVRATHLAFALGTAFRAFQGIAAGNEQQGAAKEAKGGASTSPSRPNLALMTPALTLVQNVYRRYAKEDAFSFADIADLPICATGVVSEVLAQHGCVAGCDEASNTALAKAASVVAADVILQRLREKGREINAMDLEHVLLAVKEGIDRKA